MSPHGAAKTYTESHRFTGLKNHREEFRAMTQFESVERTPGRGATDTVKKSP